MPVIPPSSNKTESSRDKYLFDTLESQALSDEQRLAALSQAHRTLVVAAAGSGKTSTLLAKIAHALMSGQYQAHQILALTFNTQAAVQLRARLQNCLASYGSGQELPPAYTLHALGLAIVRAVEGDQLKVAVSESEQSNGATKKGFARLARVLGNLLKTDPVFADQWLFFRLCHRKPVASPDDFSTRKQWRRFVYRHGVRDGRRRGFVTQNGEFVPTPFEQAVADWLYVHGWIYHYRRRPVWAVLPRVWFDYAFTPLYGRAGFVLTERKQWLICINDHKAALLAQTPTRNVLYLSIARFRDGSLFTYLRQQLLDSAHCKLEQAPHSLVWARLRAPLTPAQQRLLLRFVFLARGKGWAGPVTLATASEPLERRAAARFLPMLARLVQAYTRQLEEGGSIDFEGMLERATRYLNEGSHQHPYRLIVVDEFQDTAAGGRRLLQALLDQQPACRFYAVGDDWQSIYRFAGAVPDILTRFERYFGPARRLTLNRTFRFDQRLADAAGTFIMQNPEQLSKQVVARAAARQVSMVLSYYACRHMLSALCVACLAAINEQGHTRPTVFILARYRHHRPADLSLWQARFKQLDIVFHTMHAAKGLEADAVIMMGLQAGHDGMPCQVKDDALLSYVLPEAEPFAYAEERRLFYVGMTRTRGTVYLLAHRHRPSPFINELLTLERKLTDPSSQSGPVWIRQWAPTLH